MLKTRLLKMRILKTHVSKARMLKTRSSKVNAQNTNAQNLKAQSGNAQNACAQNTNAQNANAQNTNGDNANARNADTPSHLALVGICSLLNNARFVSRNLNSSYTPQDLARGMPPALVPLCGATRHKPNAEPIQTHSPVTITCFAGRGG